MGEQHSIFREPVKMRSIDTMSTVGVESFDA